MKKIIILILAVLTVVSFSLSIPGFSHATGSAPPEPEPVPPPPVGNGITQVETMYGDVKGFITDEGVVAFLGIPYAKPPVGELRFAPPVPGEPWDNTLDAMDFGPACPQPEIEPSDIMNWETDEDCLTLNVWTPSVDNQERAVMFWIHGGGYIWESAGDKLYHGARMAARGNVVVVSVEYRLGAFGFSYFEEVPGSGNAGPCPPGGAAPDSQGQNQRGRNSPPR